MLHRCVAGRLRSDRSLHGAIAVRHSASNAASPRRVGMARSRDVAGRARRPQGAAMHRVCAARSSRQRGRSVAGCVAALERLEEGNERYVEGVARRHDFRHEREALRGGQNPYAAILSCADSRIAPEYAFDSGRGDLFVCRVAGNFANDDTIASLEYAVAVLNTPLILVLGHDACGASTRPSSRSRTTPRCPAICRPWSWHCARRQDGAGQGGDALANAIRQNVQR